MVTSLKDGQCNKLVGIIIILFQMAPLIQCFCDWRVPYFPVYYPEEGELFILDAVGFRKPYTWRKDDRLLALETCEGHNDPNCTQPIYLIPNRTDLNFQKITLEDSGKYILEMFCPEIRVSSFEIIVQKSPFVLSDCKDMTVKEGENITCVCKTTSGYKPASANVTWTRTEPYQENLGLKNSTGILRLENISKNQSGTYTCFAASQNLANTISFSLKVVSKNYIRANNNVEIEYFEAFRRAGVGYCKLIIICKARGIPEPRYTITHIGTAVEYENVFTINTKKKSSLGHYECLARNTLGSDRRLLFLNETFLKACFDSENVICNNEMEWKLRIIVGASSFLAGILVFCILMCCCKKSSKKNDRDENCEGEYDDVRPRSPPDESVEMRLCHTPGSPGIEVERDSAEYDIPESGNTNEQDCYYDSNYTEFVASRDKEDKISFENQY